MKEEVNSIKQLSLMINMKMSTQLEILRGHLVGKATEYYKNGKVASKGSMNGVEDREKLFDISLLVKFSKGEYKMDRMDGKCVEYYSSGKIKKEGVFENGYLIRTLLFI